MLHYEWLALYWSFSSGVGVKCAQFSSPWEARADTWRNLFRETKLLKPWLGKTYKKMTEPNYYKKGYDTFPSLIKISLLLCFSHWRNLTKPVLTKKVQNSCLIQCSGPRIWIQQLKWMRIRIHINLSCWIQILGPELCLMQGFGSRSAFIWFAGSGSAFNKRILIQV